MDRLLLCQEDAYRWTATATVVSCESIDNEHWNVILDDSPFYPEGGGQPADLGRLGEVTVVDVQKDRAGRVFHTTTAPLAPGPVEAVVDGARRFDHMQQHTAQHLITAIAQDRFGRATTSFHLGQQTSSIDLDGPLKSGQVRELEDAVNAELRQDRPVRARVVDAATYAALGVRSRGLPAGYDGPVRLVGIEGLDLNTCGGTHVARLGELQLIHLIGTEKVRGGARLSYVAGGRALARMRASTARAAQLNTALKCGPDDHLSAVRRLLDDAKQAGRTRRQLTQELATLLGQQLAGQGGGRLHRPEADLNLLRGIADACVAEGGACRLLLTGGDDTGVFFAVAPEAVLKGASADLLAALKARGGGRGMRMQGKAQALSEENREAAWKVLSGG